MASDTKKTKKKKEPKDFGLHGFDLLRPMRVIFHIEAGDKGWEPRTEDLNRLTDLFADAIMAKEDISVLATRHNVRVSMLEVPINATVKVVGHAILVEEKKPSGKKKAVEEQGKKKKRSPR